MVPIDPKSNLSPVGDALVRGEHTWPRRDSISLSKNPRSKLDYVITCNIELANITIGNFRQTDVQLKLRYVPDQEIITAVSELIEYRSHLAQVSWPTLADLGTAVVADFNDVVMPRWLEIQLLMPEEGTIYLQDRQPKWDNPNLLSRIQSWH